MCITVSWCTGMLLSRTIWFMLLWSTRVSGVCLWCGAVLMLCSPYTLIPFVILSRGRFIMLPFTDAPPTERGTSVNGNIIKRPRDRITKGITVYPYSCIDQRKFEANFNRLLITLILYLHVVFYFTSSTLWDLFVVICPWILSSYSIWWYFVLATHFGPPAVFSGVKNKTCISIASKSLWYMYAPGSISIKIQWHNIDSLFVLYIKLFQGSVCTTFI